MDRACAMTVVPWIAMALTVNVPMGTASRAIPHVKSVTTARQPDASTVHPNNASAVSGMRLTIAMEVVVVRTTVPPIAQRSPPPAGPIPVRPRKVAASTPTKPLALYVLPSTALTGVRNKTTPIAMEVVVARPVVAAAIAIATHGAAVRVVVAQVPAAVTALVAVCCLGDTRRPVLEAAVPENRAAKVLVTPTTPMTAVVASSVLTAVRVLARAIPPASVVTNPIARVLPVDVRRPTSTITVLSTKRAGTVSDCASHRGLGTMGGSLLSILRSKYPAIIL